MTECTLQAGAAKTDITPPLGTLINGEFTSRYANYIADPLYAKCLVLRDSHLTLALVMVDICAMQKDFLDGVKARIRQETGILPEHTLIASTHTHSGGSVTDLLMGHADLAYRSALPCRIVEAVKRALSVLVPSRIAFGAVNVPQHVLCRRYYLKGGTHLPNPVTGGYDQLKTNPFGKETSIVQPASVVDPEVSFMAVTGVDGSWISLLANYSLHYVGDCDRGTISADYFGHFSETIGSLIGAGDTFVGMMSNGTSGEVNVWDFVNPGRYPSGNHEKSRLIGKEVAEAVCQALQHVVWEKEPSLAAVYDEPVIASRKPSPDELKQAIELVKQTDYEDIVPDDEGYVRIYAREQVLLNEYPDRIPFPVQAFRIGSGIIGALGGEFFAETGLLLKRRRSGKGAYFTVCLANDYVGYVPPAHEMEKGGYETWRCRTSRLTAEAEEQIRTQLTDFISLLER